MLLPERYFELVNEKIYDIIIKDKKTKTFITLLKTKKSSFAINDIVFTVVCQLFCSPGGGGGLCPGDLPDRDPPGQRTPPGQRPPPPYGKERAVGILLE